MIASLIESLHIGTAVAIGAAASVVVLMVRRVRGGVRGLSVHWRRPGAVVLAGVAVVHGALAVLIATGGARGAAFHWLAVVSGLALAASGVTIAVMLWPRAHARRSLTIPASMLPEVATSTATELTAELPADPGSRLIGLLLEGTADSIGTPLPTNPEEFDARLMHANRMQSIGRLAGGIAHDFNNLLTSILTSAELARQALPAEHGVTPDLEEIRRAGTRASELTRQLLAFARRDVSRPRVIDVNALVGNLATMLRRVLGETITLRLTLGTDVPLLLADSAQLEQVIVNLAVNARDAMPRGGELQLRTSRGHPSRRLGHDDTPTGVVLVVQDSGQGMSAEVRDRLFEPFFTTKNPGRGTGLGLATCHAIVVAHGGEIDVESRPGEGSTFRIWLPPTDDLDVVRQPSVPHAARVPATGSPRTIVVAEDDLDVRASATRTLRRAGNEVLEAGNGPEALAILQERGGAVDLLVADVVMPRMGGAELARELRLRWPSLPTLFVSGYPVDSAEVTEVERMGIPVLAKPYTPSILLFEVRLRLDAARPA